MSRVVMLLSGGMDSTVLFYRLLDGGHSVRALGIDYGQSHLRELGFAKALVEKHYQRFTRLSLAGVYAQFYDNPITGTASMPEVSKPQDPRTKEVVVPGRNVVFLSCALSIAANDGAEAVYFGATASDMTSFPDCRVAFVEAFNRMAGLAIPGGPKVLAPFVSRTKADVAAMGNNLGVDWSETYSCYEGKPVHCGRCPACAERVAALGDDDTTVYDRTPEALV